MERARLTSKTAELIVDVIDGALVIAHWGAPIGPISNHLIQALTPSVTNSGFDTVQHPGVMREGSRGFLGRSALSGHRDGKSWSSHFQVTQFKSDSNTITAHLKDSSAALTLVYTFSMDSFGVLTLQATIENIGNDRYTLNEFIYWLPLPQEARQSLDFAGRWSNERQPQRREIEIGTWVR